MEPVQDMDPRRQEILGIIAKQSGREVDEDATLADLDMDSLDNIELAIAIEDLYYSSNITIDDDLWIDNTTAGQVVDDVIRILQDVE